MGNFFREGTEVEMGIGSLSLMTRLSRVLVTQYKPGTELNVLVRRSQAFIDETDDKALAESILGELDDELRKLEERAFLAGVRSDEPQGIFTSTAYERRKAVLGIDAVIDLVYSIQPAHRQHAIFIANSHDYRDLRQLKDVNDRPRPTKPQIKAVEKWLKEVHARGMLAIQPGRGGIALYSLTTPICTNSQTAAAIGDSEGGETDAPAVDAQREEFTLLHLIADIRAAAGDPTGRLMQDELVQHIAAIVKERDDLRERLDAQIKQWQADTGRLTSDLRAAMESRSQTINEADRLRAELAAERQAREALQEQNDGVDVKDAAVGYLIRVPKRDPIIRRKPESARLAALGAVRAGAARAEVLAVVPVGVARRGAEWGDA